MHPASTAIGLSWCALDANIWLGLAEKWERYGEARLPLAESVVYYMCGVWGGDI